MSAIVITFPPSKNFEAYLQSFMRSSTREADPDVKIFAKHCLVKLERICIKGPRGKVPTIAEIDRAKASESERSMAILNVDIGITFSSVFFWRVAQLHYGSAERHKTGT